MIGPIAIGLAASAVALVQLLGWLALGSALLPRRTRPSVAAPVSILLASGLTASLAAVLCALGAVRLAALLIVLLPLSALTVRAGKVGPLTRTIASGYRKALGPSKLATGLAAVLGTVYWVSAAAPPRDADVMRYHLAHIRQILDEGRWAPIPDVHYALPFGWTLNFLPFEWIGLPEAAQMLNLGLWLVALGGILALLGRGPGSTGAVLFALALAAHPNLVKAVTTAQLDSYAMFAVFAVTVVLARMGRPTPAMVGMLGFAAWIGIQSRYQLVALGLATTLLWLRTVTSRRQMVAFAAGSAAAVLLASPFYLMNALSLGNPVWPLLTSVLGEGGYPDRVAGAFANAFSGSYRPGAVLGSLWRLVREPLLFPIPLLALSLSAFGWFSGDRFVRRLAGLAGAFLLVWVLAQPSLYPRFSLYLVPIVAVAGGRMLVRHLSGERGSGWFSRPIPAVAGLATIVLLGADALYAADAAAYLRTGDSRRYHAYTWYHPVYMWANGALPEGSRLLLVVMSGHSYHLRHHYRRADPSLSAVVNWETMRSGRQLWELMSREGYDYMLLDESADWTEHPGGERMTAAVHDALRDGLLVPVRRFQVRRATSRLRRTFESSSVVIVRRHEPAGDP